MTGPELAERLAAEVSDRSLNAAEMAHLVSLCERLERAAYERGKRDADLAAVMQRAPVVNGAGKRRRA